MTPARALFDEVVDLPHEQRVAFLDARCADPSCRLEVLQLLSWHDQVDDDFLQPVGWVEGVAPRDHSGETAGAYSLVAPLARGGMATVYRGRRADGRFESDVAVKVLDPGSGITAAQIDQERRALAILQHPNITRLIDAGELATGEPFLVMELVDGQPLDAYCRLHGLAPRAIVRLFLQVCAAVDAAHRTATLHRDLKPSNILVTPAGHVKLLDFGIARRIDPAPAASLGPSWMTAGYASPEQVRGDALTTGSDIYSLGVILSELIAHPSRDLAAVIAKARHADAGQRYAYVDQLVDDLKCLLEARPVSARKYTPAYRAQRFLTRNAVPSVLAGVAGIAVAVTVGMRISHGQEAERLAGATRRLLYAAEMRLAAQAFEAGSPSITRTLLERHLPAAGQEDIRGIEWYLLRHLQPQAAAALPITSEVNGVAWSPDDRWLATAANDGAITLWNPDSGQREAVLGTHAGKAWSVAFSSDGRSLASVGTDGFLRVWRVTDRTLSFEVVAHRVAARAVAFFPDSRQIVTGGDDGAVSVRDLASPNASRALSTEAGYVRSVDVSPDGRRIAATTDDGRILVWSGTGTTPDRVLRGGARYVTRVRFASNSQDVVSASLDGSILLWNLITGRLRASDHVDEGMMEAVAVTRDGQTVIGGHGPWVTFWRTDDWEIQRQQAAHDGRVTAMSLSTSGRRLATTGSDIQVKVWDLRTPASLPAVLGHQGDAWSIAFSSDSTRLASAGNDGALHVWDAVSGAQLQTIATGPASAKGVTFGAQGHVLFGAPRGGEVLGWDLASGSIVARLSHHSQQVYKVALSPDQSLLASAGEDGTAALWDLTTHRRRAVLPHAHRVRGVAFSADGARVATASEDQTIAIWRAVDGAKMATLRGHTESVFSVAFSPDGTLVATSSADRTIRLWDARTYKEVASLIGHGDRVWSVTFSPDGQRLASASSDSTVRIWDVETRRELVALKGPTAWRDVAFAPDGEKLAASSASGGIWLWHAPRDQR